MTPISSKDVLRSGSDAHTATGCPTIRHLGACLTHERALDALRPVWCLRAMRDQQRSAAKSCAAQSGAGAPQSLVHVPGCNVQRADGIGFAGYAKNHLAAIFFTLPLRPTVPRTVGFPTCRREAPVVCIDRNCGFVRGWSAASGAVKNRRRCGAARVPIDPKHRYRPKAALNLATRCRYRSASSDEPVALNT